MMMRRRGFSLIEMTAAIAVTGVVMAGLWQLTGTSGQMQQATLLGQQARAVAGAGQQYIENNRSQILALGALSAINSSVCIKVTDSDPCATTLPSLKAEGYLPATFPENSVSNGQNSYRQTYRFYVRREGGAAAAANDKLIGLMLTTGGTEIPDALGARVAPTIGAAGGFIYDADDTDPAGTSPGAANATAARGAAGGWTIDLTATGWAGIGAVAQQGRLAILTSLLPQTAVGTAAGACDVNNSINIRQSTGVVRHEGGWNSHSFSMGALPTAGSSIIVIVEGFSNSGTGILWPVSTTSGISDNQGNTYTRIAFHRPTTPYDASIAVYLASNIGTPTGTFTITATPTSVDHRARFAAIEVQGLASASVVDQLTTLAMVNSVTRASITSGTTAQANELALAIHAWDSNGGVKTDYTWSEGWQDIATSDGNISSHAGTMSVLAKKLTETGPVSINWNFANTAYWSYGLLLTLRGDTATPACAAETGTGSISVVQTMPVVLASAASTSNGSFSANPSAGNSIIVTISDYLGSPPQPTTPLRVRDNNGNLYQHVAGTYYGQGNNGGFIFAAHNITATTLPLVITVETPGSFNWTRWGAIEVSGLSRTNPVSSAMTDGCYSGVGCVAGTTTRVTGVPFKTDRDQTLAVAVAAATNSNSWGAGNAAAGWTTHYNTTGTALSVGTRILSQADTVSHTWNFSSVWPVELISALAVFNGADPTLTPPSDFDGLADSVTDYSNRNFGAGQYANSGITTGQGNTAIGPRALRNNTTGSNNTAVGLNALASAPAPNDMTVIGPNSATSTSLGDRITVIGAGALTSGGYTDTIAISGTFWGGSATGGQRNIAIGNSAIAPGTQGSDNLAIGESTCGTGVGGATPSTFSRNICIGYNTMYLGGSIAAGNVLIGTNSATNNNSDAAFNTCMGDYTCYGGMGAAGRVTGVGQLAGYWANTGSDVTNIGSLVGQFGTSGNKTGSTSVGYQALLQITSGQNNTAIGRGAGSALTTGTRNVAIGWSALSSATSTGANTGNDNVAVGHLSQNLRNGARNTTVGAYTMPSTISNRTDNTLLGVYAGQSLTGSQATFLGAYAGRYVTTGANITTAGEITLVGAYTLHVTSVQSRGTTAVGYEALRNNNPVNTAGNTAVGYQAMRLTSSGYASAAAGAYALGAMTSGYENTAVGWSAMPDITGISSSANTAVGYYALRGTVGVNNVAIGSQAMGTNHTNAINANTAIGFEALGQVAGASMSNNTAVGYRALWSLTSSGASNTAIGNQADVSNGVSNSTAIGNGARVTTSNTIVVGNTALTWIGGQVAWTNTSDRRIKKDIAPTDLGLDFILALKPARYHLRNGDGRLDYGFIAQDIVALLGDRQTNMVYQMEDAERTYRLASAELLAPLVRAMQEHQRDIRIAQARNASLRQELQRLQRQSARLEAEVAQRQLVQRIQLQQSELKLQQDGQEAGLARLTGTRPASGSQERP